MRIATVQDSESVEIIVLHGHQEDLQSQLTGRRSTVKDPN